MWDLCEESKWRLVAAAQWYRQKKESLLLEQAVLQERLRVVSARREALGVLPVVDLAELLPDSPAAASSRAAARAAPARITVTATE